MTFYVAWVNVPGDIELNFFWDEGGRFPVIVIRGEELNWKEYLQAFGSEFAVQYHDAAWENRIQWTPNKSIDWHKQEAGVCNMMETLHNDEGDYY